MFNLGFAFDHCSGKVKPAGEVDRAILIYEDHRLLWRETEGLIISVVFDVAVSGLSERPFPDIALRQTARPLGELARARSASAIESLEKPQSKTQPRGGHAERASKVAKHLADEVIQFVRIELRHRRSPS